MSETILKTGKVLILNGTSSSGKSSLAKLIQSLADKPYLLLSLDAFWDMTPAHIPAGSKHFPNMKLAIAKAVKGLCDTGHYVIVDTIFCGNKSQRELLGEMASKELCFIKVSCPLAELNRREAARGDRKVGLAESQISSVHAGVSYDFEIDTSLENIQERVEELLGTLQYC